MKTIIWKEIRENLKWGALALAALVLAEIYALSKVSQDSSDMLRNVTLCAPLFLLVSSFGCALIGAALACLQILPELKRDQWASLLHRPTSPLTIFSGKAIAGSLLYLAATLIPLAISTGYVATPGRFAVPFVPGLMLPALSDVLLGLTFYAAALAICLHRGRWYGSRALIALSLIPVFVQHTSYNNPYPFLLSTVAIAVFFLAAAGGILSGSSVTSRPRLSRWAHVAISLLGAQALISIVGLGLRSASAKLNYKPEAYEFYQVTQEGQILRFLRQSNGDGYRVLTVAGEPVTDEKYLRNDSYQSFVQLLPIAWDLQKSGDFNYYARFQTRSSQQWVAGQSYRYNASENWFLLLPERVFVGYDRLSRRKVGLVDSEGFKAPDAPVVPFPHSPIFSYNSFYSTLGVYSVGQQVLALEFYDRRFESILQSPEKIYTASQIRSYNDESNFICVASERGIQVFEDKGTPLLTTPYRHDTRQWPMLSIGRNEAKNRYYVQYEPTFSAVKNVPPPTNIFIDELDSTGHLLQTHTLPSYRFKKYDPDLISRSTKLANPLLPTALVTAYRTIVPEDAISEMFFITFVTDFIAKPNQLWLILALAVVLAAVTYLWAIRSGFSRRDSRLWSLFVFCFGLPGLLTFRVAIDWPARVPCPDCRQARPIGTSVCPACQKPWAPPAPNGLEIIDRPSSPPAST